MQSEVPPPGFGNTFYSACHDLLKDQLGIDIHCDVTLHNCLAVYVTGFAKTSQIPQIVISRYDRFLPWVLNLTTMRLWVW